MELPPATHLLLEIEQRQDEVLRELEDLNTQLERTLAEYQSQLKVFQESGDGPIRG